MNNFFSKSVNDTDESLKGKSAGTKFGLNHGFFAAIEFIEDAGKDKSLGYAIDIKLKSGEREINRRLYDITGKDLYGKNGLIKPGEDGYDEKFEEEMTQLTAVTVHALKAVGITQEAIDKVYTNGITDFVDFAKKMLALLPNNYKTIPIDFFLEYQWQIGKDQSKTYPEVPKNMKGGRFLSQAIKPVGKWIEDKTDGLSYVDEAGNKHPFERNSNFMESAKGYEQTTESTKPTLGNSAPAPATW